MRLGERAGGHMTDQSGRRRATSEVVREEVELRIPADSAFLSVLRTATAGLAARLDFTLDEIEDLRIAVDEACALLLPDVVPGGGLVCRFGLEPGAIEVTVLAETRSGTAPARDNFAWTVLTALAGEVETWVDDQTVVIRLHKSRGGVAGQ
jgi:serine/threonine-protein kinase RsbW